MTFVPGFNPQEAEPILALLAQLEDGLNIPPLPPLSQPAGWTLQFDSQSIGPFDNRWQLWKSPQGQYAVLIRGTVVQAGSIIDDLLSVMIPANSQIGFQIGGTSVALNYQFAAANNTKAGVHLGFTLATFILMYDPDAGILWKLLAMVPPGSDVFIAGHSQGAAIATLSRSYLNYLNFLDLTRFGTLYNYKSYVFAQPKPGNDLYGIDYDVVASNSGLGFTVNNSQDWVPQVPFTIELLNDINIPNPISVELGSHLLTRLALKEVESAANHLREGIAVVQVSKHLPKMTALASIFQDPKFQQKVLGKPIAQGLSLGSPVLPPILPTLNFAGCGSTYGLLGSPGVNPCEASDSFWQHHAAMYYALLQGTPIPTTC
jgi:Lipase (class 3)